MPDPFMPSWAAELWNKPSSGSSTISNRSLYNKSAKRPGNDVVLYNRSGGLTSSVSNVREEFISSLKGYEAIRKSKQSSSKLWKFVNLQKIQNRQSDIDRALQHEYDLQIANSKSQLERIQKYEKVRVEAYQSYLETVASGARDQRDSVIASLFERDVAVGNRSRGGSTLGGSVPKERVSKSSRPRLYNSAD